MNTTSSNRICVIGAGPGGLSMALLLKKRGHEITVLEKQDRPGGMCHSVEHGGKWFDIGANYVTKDYREVRALAIEYGLDLTADKAFQNQMALDIETGKVENAQKVINSGHSMFAFGIAGIRYFLKQFRYRKLIGAPGYQGVSTHDELMMPFGDWLRANKMAPLQKLFMVPITAMGFGTLDDIATPHALRYVNASRFWSMVKTGLHIPQRWPKRFMKGFGGAWTRVAEGLDVEYETETVSVKRSSETVYVTTKDADGVEQTREFDQLVVGIPPNAALEFLDATEFERSLFGKETVLFNHYVVATATIENFPWWVVNTMQPAAEDSGRYPTPDGHPYIFGKQWKSSDLTLFYAPIGTDADRDQIHGRMKADSALSATGHDDYRFGTWKNFADWPRYFPRVSIEDMAGFGEGAGWYDQVEALQGSNRTYYCHGILSFELVELVMRYARNLVEQHFD